MMVRSAILEGRIPAAEREFDARRPGPVMTCHQAAGHDMARYQAQGRGPLI